MDTIKEIEETAKATQEVAKTVGKGIDLIDKFGGFISKYISGTIAQGIGIFEDKLKYMRWERQIRLMDKANELLKERGLKGPTKEIPLKLAIPLLEGASLEEDDYLQDLWANLLVNSATADRDVNLHRVYIDILERLTPFEANILQKLYSLPMEETMQEGITTGNLPDKVEISKDKNDMIMPSKEVILALINLARLGCIFPARSWGGSEIFSSVNPTYLGYNFVKACAR